MKYVILFACLLVIITVSVKIGSYNDTFLAEKGIYGSDTDMLTKLFGEFRDYLSDISFLTADLYFHGGLPHTLEEGETLHLLQETTAGGHSDGHHHTGHEDTGTTSTGNLLIRLCDRIQISEHRHLHGNEEKELLPWIYYSTRLNPHNILAYVVGSYWIGIRMNDPEKAMSFLKRGIIDNQDSWQLYKAMGDVSFISSKNYTDAVRYLEQARDLAERQGADPVEKRAVCVFLAESYMKLGMADKAMNVYKSLEKEFPGDQRIITKLKAYQTSSP